LYLPHSKGRRFRKVVISLGSPALEGKFGAFSRVERGGYA